MFSVRTYGAFLLIGIRVFTNGLAPTGHSMPGDPFTAFCLFLVRTYGAMFMIGMRVYYKRFGPYGAFHAGQPMPDIK
ncbi:hypothetical protein EZE20_16570 [Arundinibacter roseus]|uniref:Uncharacterized protein n=1 Tax=Arundinibacter roseus TaxID=2070510 RepID=A0A4R4KAH7_9BACT|nr:hypothetical protein EZE20_16570 [Arundinibacter roseus]